LLPDGFADVHALNAIEQVACPESSEVMIDVHQLSKRLLAGPISQVTRNGK